jgi:acyl-coenzyme A thioesterase PaaI-like protein
MMAARMTAAELDAFLRAELPQMFDYDDLTIEHADGRTCRLRQRFRENMLRPGGTVSGPTLMALADCAMYVVVLSAIGPVGLALTTNLNINLRKGQPARRAGRCRLLNSASGLRSARSIFSRVHRPIRSRM